ncbi:MAG: hypothetical protein AAFP76_16055 [Bacteroidota bacterium]
MNPPLTAQLTYTQLIANLGISNWEHLLSYVAAIPYGRTSNRQDLSLVISEGKGSCSSKHAFLKCIAMENKIPNVQLILGLYKMNAINTPGIGTVIDDHGLDYIPEAHCYLKIGENRRDLTHPNASFNRIAKDLIEEIEIQPEQITSFKVSFHQEFLKSWVIDNSIPLSFEQIWEIREQCIQNLSTSKTHLQP